MEIVKKSIASKRPELLEAEFIVRANDQLHLISDLVREKKGVLDSEEILFRYKDWLGKV